MPSSGSPITLLLFNLKSSVQHFCSPPWTAACQAPLSMGCPRHGDPRYATREDPPITWLTAVCLLGLIFPEMPETGLSSLLCALTVPRS